MIRFKQDYASLVIVLLNLSFLLTGFITPIGLGSLAIIPFLGLFCYLSLNINHNQLHLGIFISKVGNLITNILLSLTTGLPVSLLYLPHLVNHHPNSCNEKDWTGAHLVAGHKGLKRIILYIIRANVSLLKNRPKSIFAHLPPERKISLLFEMASLLLLSIGLLFSDYMQFLVHILAPWIIGQNILLFMNFFLHDDCDYNSERNHSHSFNSPIANRILFNGGYHLAHHLNPNLHWSKLPMYHQESLGLVSDNLLNSKSMTRHFINLYLQKKANRD